MGPASARYRCDFWEVATDLYGESFFRPVREYCDTQNLGYIGHLLYEGELVGLTRSQGDFFKAIRNLTYGGCDFLTDLTWPVPSTPWGPLNNVAAPKFASSASHLLGKTRTMSEAFGLCQKNNGDSMLTGISVRVGICAKLLDKLYIQGSLLLSFPNCCTL